MSWLLSIILAFIIIYSIARAFRGSVKHSAVQNAFLAKYTYNQLAERQKEEVRERTLRIAKQGGLLEEDLQSVSEMLKFSFYALAMAELNIPPALTNEEWHYVKNPYMAIHKSEHQLQVVKHHLASKHNVHIDLK